MSGAIRRLSVACCLIVAAVAIGGCPMGKKEPSSSYPGYYLQEPGNKGVIVFMHGVLGSAEDTWKNSETGAFWPELVKTDPEFKGWDIYVYGFPSELFSRSMSVPEISEDLRAELENARIFDHRDVIFVCHSMGGLITRDFLQKYQKYASKIKFIYFFATPTEGSEISGLGKWLSRNPQFGDMIPITDENYLGNQLLAWLAAQFPIPSYCAYEDQRTVGQQVVPMRSAAALCNRPLTPISANHMQIVKPKGHNDKPHKLLQNALRETQTVHSINIPNGWTLRQVIESVIRSDMSTGDEFRTNYVGCEDSLLDGTRMRPGQVNAETRELLIEKLASRTEALKSTFRLKVTRDEENAVYEIRCEH